MSIHRTTFPRSAVLAVQRNDNARSLALLVARVVLAWIFIYHGAGKLFDYKALGGIDGTAAYFDSIGLSPSTFLAYVSGLTEFVGGIMLLFGVLSPVAGIALVVDMVVAMVATNFGNGLISEKAAGGFEINLALAGLALVIVVFGAGRFSLDRSIGLASD